MSIIDETRALPVGGQQSSRGQRGLARPSSSDRMIPFWSSRHPISEDDTAAQAAATDASGGLLQKGDA